MWDGVEIDGTLVSVSGSLDPSSCFMLIKYTIRNLYSPTLDHFQGLTNADNHSQHMAVLADSHSHEQDTVALRRCCIGLLLRPNDSQTYLLH